MVISIILYNSEIWDAYLFRNKQILCENNEFLFDMKNILEDLHIKFMKVVLGVHRKAYNLAIRSELGRLPLHIKIFSSVLEYWAHLDELNDNPITINALETNMELFASKKFSWISQVNKLLDVLRMSIYRSDVHFGALQPRSSSKCFTLYYFLLYFVFMLSTYISSSLTQLTIYNLFLRAFQKEFGLKSTLLLVTILKFFISLKAMTGIPVGVEDCKIHVHDLSLPGTSS